MPLIIPQPTEDVAAALLAQQVIGQLLQNARRVADLLDNGVASQAAVAPTTREDGSVIPGRAAVSGISAAKFRAACGDTNLTRIEGARTALLD